LICRQDTDNLGITRPIASLIFPKTNTRVLIFLSKKIYQSQHAVIRINKSTLSVLVLRSVLYCGPAPWCSAHRRLGGRVEGGEVLHAAPADVLGPAGRKNQSPITIPSPSRNANSATMHRRSLATFHLCPDPPGSAKRRCLGATWKDKNLDTRAPGLKKGGNR